MKFQQAPKFAICAFLCNRDATGINANKFAESTKTQLVQLKRVLQDNVQVLVAWDHPYCQPKPESWFWEYDNLETSCKKFSKSEMSLPGLLTEFVEWCWCRTSDCKNRIFLFSGHGTAGYGLGQHQFTAAQLLALSLRIELSEFVDVFPEIVLKNTRDDGVIDIQSAIEKLTPTIPQLPEFDFIRNLPKEVKVNLSAILNRVREQPRYVEVGTTLLASGRRNKDPQSKGDGISGASGKRPSGIDSPKEPLAQEPDSLSVRQFREILKKNSDVANNHQMPFDIIMLQACSLGLVEVAYELRDVCEAVIMSTTPYVSTPAFDRGIIASRAHVLADGAKFVEATCHELIHAYFDFRTYDSVSTSALIASYVNEPHKWPFLRDGFRKLCDVIMELPDNWICDSVAARMRKVRSQLRIGDGGSCAQENFDLVRFYSAATKSFLKDARDTHDRLENFITTMMNLTIYQQATPTAACDCGATGLGLYFPESKKSLFSSYRPPEDSQDPDGFDWIAETGWRDVLDKIYK